MFFKEKPVTHICLFIILFSPPFKARERRLKSHDCVCRMHRGGSKRCEKKRGLAGLLKCVRPELVWAALRKLCKSGFGVNSVKRCACTCRFAHKEMRPREGSEGCAILPTNRRLARKGVDSEGSQWNDSDCSSVFDIRVFHPQTLFSGF